MEEEEDIPVKSLHYLKDLLTKVCIQALESEQIGEWVFLLEVLDRIMPLGDELIESGEVRHYIKRVFRFCVDNQNLQSLDIISALKKTFPKLDFISLLSEPDIASPAISPTIINETQNNVKNEKIIIPKEPYLAEDFQDIFRILPEDLEERVYEPKQLNIIDIQKFLPFVVAELAKLESTWKHCLGSTITALNTNLPQTIYKPSKSPSRTNTPFNDNKHSKHEKLNDGMDKPKTGREVVEYLVRSNRNMKADIWYLNFVPSKRYDPYNLKVASKRTVKKDHVVISVFGVLHVRQNSNSELTSLVQWYMESRYFNVLQNINTFRNYLIIKTFKRWIVNHRHKQFAKIFKKVKNNILIDLPSFPNTIRQISTFLNQFELVELLPDCSSGHIHAKGISFLMREQLEIGAKYFSRLFIYSQDVFDKCHAGSIDYINYCQAQLDAQQYNNSKESMSTVRKRKELQKDNLLCANRNLRRLNQFVNLINHLIFSHLVYIHSQHLHDFVHFHLLQNEHGCFYTFIDVSADSLLVLSPPGDIIFNILSKALVDILNCINYHHIKKVQLNNVSSTDETRDEKKDSCISVDFGNVLEERLRNKFSQHPPEVDVISNENTCNYTEAILKHELVASSLNELEQQLIQATEEADNLLNSYSWIYEIIKFTLSWNTGEMNTWKSLPPSLLEKQILQINAWLKEIENIIPNFISSNGVLFIDCSTIASTLQPQLNYMLEKMISELALDNFEEVEYLSCDLNQKIEILSKIPTDIQSFAKYFVYVNDLELEIEEVKKKVDHLRGVLDVIKHCCRQLTSKEEENGERVVKVWEDFMFSLQTAKDYIDTQSAALVKNMNEEIMDMQKKVLDIVQQATYGVFVDASQEPSYVLKEMKQLYNTFESVLENLKLYGACKAKITGEGVDLREVQTAQKAINARYEVWRYLELSWQTINEWKHTLFGKLNVKKVYGKVQEWLLAADNLKADIPQRDGVMKKWVDLIKGFSNNINVMKELSNPALKIRHWKEIFVVLGHVYEDKLYRVSDIISMPIIDNVYKISQICLAASAESALQNCLNTLIKHWEKRNFKFAKKLQEMDVKKDRREVGNVESEIGGNEKNKLTTVGYTLTGIDELACELEDNLVTLQSMLGSPHVAEVRDLAGSWNAKLQEVKEILDLWMVTQQEWLYLGNVFSKETMQQRHPVEFHIFIETNQLFKELIDSIMADSTVLNILNTRTEKKGNVSNNGYLKEILQQVTSKQSVVIKQMEEYLSKIQSTFPRLYYLSNDEMLNLLAITRNPPAIVPFVKKCFPAIMDLKFGMPKTENVLSSLDVTLNVHRLEATGIVGHLDENVMFHESLPFNTSIEKWLKLIEIKMKECVWVDFGESAQEINDEYMNQICDIDSLKMLTEKFTFQSISLYMDVHQSKLCKDVLIQRKTFSHIQSQQDKDISTLSTFLQESRCFHTGSSPEKKFLMLVQVLLMKALHYKDKLLVLKNCEKLSLTSFDWLKLVKFTTGSDDIELTSKEEARNVTVNCLDVSFQYGYEYFGPMNSLVYTPLSDRCFVSLFRSLKDHQVACLTGYQQTGKSETSFEFAKLLGRHFISLNCTDITPLSVINTFLHGALTTGSILCLENIHLLKCNKLSVLGQIFSDLNHALKWIAPGNMGFDMTRRCHSETKGSHHSSVGYDPSYLDLNRTSDDISSKKQYIAPVLGNILSWGNLVDVSTLYGCVVTTDLLFNDWKSIPDNLRESLRPVAFTNLDETYIYKIWFLISGFRRYDILAQKLKFLTDNHRDKGYFSLQKLHHLISQTGTTVQLRKFASADREIMEFSSSLINMIQPALPHRSFLNLAREINNIFTSTKDGKVRNSITDTLLLESVREQINADNLSPKAEFINKVLELHQVLSSNQSVILVGGVASGKTTCYKTLARSLCQFYSPWSQRVDILTAGVDVNFARVNMKIFYPNVLLADQLYGYFDCIKNTPVDGLLTKILSNIAFLENVTSKHNDNNISSDHAIYQIQQWFVMDGFLDESWITPFYSLLDYSKQFVLGSGKRIRLLDNMKVLFETDQLASVSPSLISRCAILHFQNGEVVNWRSVFSSWRTGAYNKYCITQQSLDCIELSLEYALESTVNFIHSECESLFNDTRPEDMKRSRNAAVVECNYVLQVLSAVLECWKSRDICMTNNETDESSLAQFMCHALAYSFANGLSALVHQSSLEELDTFICAIFSTCPVCPVILPCSIMDCYFDGKIGSLVQWSERKFSSQMSVASNMIVSKEIQQYYHLSDLLITSKCNILLVGEPGCGKSSIVKYLLSSKHQILKLQMSRAMNINCFQNIMRLKSKYWLKRQSQRGKLKSAKKLPEEKMIVFIDDVNLVVDKDDSPDQPVLECIRQMICEGGVYDFDGKYFHHLPPVQLLSSYTSPEMDFVGGSNGNSVMNPRVRRHFNLICIRTKNKEQLTSFFSRYCVWLDGLSWLSFKTKFAEMIATASVNIHEGVCLKFPASENPLYMFSKQDLSRVYKGLTMLSANGTKKLTMAYNVGNNKNDTYDGMKYVSHDVDDVNLGMEKDVENKFIELSVSGYINLQQSMDESNEQLTKMLKEVIVWWHHMINQVYNNRYVSQHDCNWFKTFLMDETKQLCLDVCTVATEVVIANEIKLGRSAEQINGFSIESEDINSYLFAPFLTKENTHTQFISKEEFKVIVCKAMEEYNECNNMEQMKLVFFDEMLYHTESLCRIVNIPSGHALLISQNGHGRNDIVKLVAKLMSAELFHISSSLEHSDHKSVIKDACNMAGLKAKPVIIFAPEGLPEATLVYLSALICDGLCPGLYSTNELPLICNQLLPVSHRMRTNSDGYGQIEDRFFQRIKQNLHIIICLHHNKHLNETLHKFPMLVHKVACIDVYKEWSDEILFRVAYDTLLNTSTLFLHNIPHVNTDDYLEIISGIMAKIHVVTGDYIKVMVGEKAIEMYSPRKFIEFVHLFLNICRQRIQVIQDEFEDLEKATMKISEAEEVIADIQMKIETLSPILTEAKCSVAHANDEMKKCQGEYIRMKHVCELQMAIIEELKIPAEKLKNETDEEFKKLTPQYDATISSLKLLDQYAIDELRSYHKPPQAVKFVCEMLCVMFGVPPQWPEAKLLLMRDKFFTDLLLYEKDTVEKGVFEKLTEFVNNPISQPEKIRSISHAAYQLSTWMHAIHSYGCILRELEPKKNALRDANEKITEAERILVEKNVRCNLIKESLEKKILDYKDKLTKSKVLEKQDQALGASLKHAQDLLNTSEVFISEWSRKTSKGKEKLKASPGDCLLTAASVVYVSMLCCVQQDELLSKWKDIFNDENIRLPLSRDISLVNILSTDEEKETWMKNREFNGTAFIENALKIRALTNFGSKCWSFMIDPHGFSKTLVRLIEEGMKVKDYSTIDKESDDLPQDCNSNCSSTSFSSHENNNGGEEGEDTLIILDADTRGLQRIIEKSMLSGSVVLLQHIERLEDTSLLLSLFDIRNNGGYFKMNNDTEIMKCHNNFRLYLSASASIHSLEEEKYNLILHQTIPYNLEVDTSALQFNILHKIISAEKPELIVNNERNKLDLLYLKQEQKQVHMNIFTKVKNLPNNLVDDTSIRDLIGYHQEQLMLLEEKIFDCMRNIEEIRTEMNKYKPLATYLTRIYHIVQKIQNIHPLYYFSLQRFMSLLESTFMEGLLTKAAISNTHARIEEAKNLFTENVYKRLSMSLFKEHVVLFPLHVVLENMKLFYDLKEEEVMLFVLGFNHENISTAEIQKPDWIEKSAWNRFLELSSTVSCFSDLLPNMVHNGLVWEEYFKLGPMATTPPDMNHSNINDFYLGLLWLAYDNTLMPSICTHFIIRELGPPFVNIPPFDFHQACILSSYENVISTFLLPDNDEAIIIDPLLVISRLANERNIPEVSVVSMNNDEQLEQAINAINIASKNGSWVVLQNCHLVKEWKQCFINSLENIHNCIQCNSQQSSLMIKNDNQFHLWMVMRSCDDVKLPAYIIENSFPIVWQFSKNDLADLESLLGEFNKDTQFPREKTGTELILQNIFQDEVLKNARMGYTEQYKISVKDLFFSIPIPTMMKNEHDKHNIVNVVKEIVYLPRLYTEYDHKLLWKSHEIEKVPKMKECLSHFATRSSLYHVGIARYEKIPTPLKCVCNIHWINHLLRKLSTVRSHSKSVKVGTTEKSLITECINEDMHIIQKSVKMIIFQLLLLKKVLENKICKTVLTEQIYNTVSLNMFPDTWKIGWIGAKIHCDHPDFNVYVEMVEKILDYLHSIFSGSGEVRIPFDLSNFNNPLKVVNCIKLQYAMKNGSNVESNVWIAKVFPGTSSDPLVCSENGVFLENINLINAKLDESLTAICSTETYGDVTKLPLIHLKPMLGEMSDHEDEVNYVNVPLYLRDRKETLFNVLIKASSELMKEDVYMLV